MKIFTTKTNCEKTAPAFLAGLFCLKQQDKKGIDQIFQPATISGTCIQIRIVDISVSSDRLIYNCAYTKICL